MITIASSIDLASCLLTMEEDPFQYVLTYKFSQDHIELMLSCIRGRGGWNNNPNALQIKYALRKMLLKNSVMASDSANCQLFEQNSIIPVFQSRKREPPIEEQNTQEDSNENET